MHFRQGARLYRLVIFTRNLTILARRDHRIHTLLLRQPDDGITLMASICQEVLGTQPLNQHPSLRASCNGT